MILLSKWKSWLVAAFAVILLVTIISSDFGTKMKEALTHNKMVSLIYVNYEKAPVDDQASDPSDQPPIPKIIHQIFSSELVFENYIPLINSCLSHNPDWKYMLWRDADAKEFVKAHFPYFNKKYNKYKHVLERSDTMRYMILYVYGGVYLDMDVECVRPFFPTLEKHTAFLDQERNEQTQFLWKKRFFAMNSAMGSRPKHPFFMQVIEAVRIAAASSNVVYSTGPSVMTDVFRVYRKVNQDPEYAVTLLDPHVMSPVIEKHVVAHCKKNIKHYQNEFSSRNKSIPIKFKSGYLPHIACMTLQEKNWRVDDSGRDTLAVHRFMHLGYEPFRKRPIKKVNLRRLFAHRIQFASVFN